jgi:glucose-1-phosphate thymidylyltransferase
MKAIILWAGYATRLFPLTENFPKPLLKINQKPMIDYIMEKIENIWIEDIFVITNDKFTKHFQDWKSNYQWKCKNIKILNDWTHSNDDKLWAIGDINFVLEKEWLNNDFLIIGWDNLFQFELNKAKELFEKNNKPTIIGYDIQDYNLAKNYWIIEIDNNSLIKSFEEKPSNPKSTICAICVYFYPKYIIPVIKEYLKDWNNPDAPWNFPARLIKNHNEVFAISHNEKWYDVGWFESLKKAKEDFWETNVSIEQLQKWNI